MDPVRANARRGTPILEDEAFTRLVSDIVKRKHIRSKGGKIRTRAGRFDKRPRFLSETSCRLELSSRARLDRQGPRMCLKQNGLFETEGQSRDLQKGRGMTMGSGLSSGFSIMRTIKCLKGIWWMPWR